LIVVNILSNKRRGKKMREKLVDALERVGLSDRTQKIISLSPGILFGFPDGNLDRMIERIDCKDCRYITEVTGELLKHLLDIDAYITLLCSPAEQANKLLMDNYDWWRSIPIVGRFFNNPVLETLPDYKRETWYLRGMEAVDQKGDTLKLLKSMDPKHWGTEQEEMISKKTISRLLSVDHIYVSSLENKLGVKSSK
jgi:hypothetical protein